MESALNPPILTGGRKPLSGIQSFRRAAGDEMDRFGFVFANMAIQLGDLLDMGETDLLRRCHLGMKLSAFSAAAVDFVGPGHSGRYGLRGKNPPAWRITGFEAFGELLFDYL